MKVGILGAGCIGRSVAIDCVLHGIDILLIDVDEGILKDALEEINQHVYVMNILNNYLKKNGDISCGTDMNLINDCNIIIENIPELWSKKKKLYQQMNRLCDENKYIFANTSCIPISQIASTSKYKKNIIGVHFMNPSYLKPVVEVIPSHFTGDKCKEIVNIFLEKLDKKCIYANDCAGFVSNRLSHQLINQAALLVEENGIDVEDVDNIMKSCFGHQMGPLETADLIGLDTVLMSLEVLYKEYKQPQYKCCNSIRKKVLRGELGKKTGKGFYKY